MTPDQVWAANAKAEIEHAMRLAAQERAREGQD